MKKLLCMLVLLLTVSCVFIACGSMPGAPADKEDVITVEDGYLVVNGNKTEHRVKTDDVIEVINGYVYVNGVKTDIYVPSCNHSWTTVTTAPTCSKAGYDTLTCKLCGKSVVENEIPRLSHTYATTYSFDDGYHWFACTGCGDAKDKAAHTPDNDGICTVCQIPTAATPGVIYDISADGTYAEVIGYDGTAAKVKIASEYKGLPVKNIYDGAFMNNKTITTVIIPDSVVSISGGEYFSGAFYGCSNLTSVVIPNSVTTIGNYAFYCCSLTSIVIPDSVISIGHAAFSGCESLISVTIGNNVTTLVSSVFSDCKNLTSIVIPGNVTTIGNRSFYGCYNLTSVVIGDGVTTIGDSAFANCGGLTSIVIPNSVQTIDGDAFAYCGSLTSVVMGNNISSIHSSTFYRCSQLQLNEYEYGKYLGNEDNPYFILLGVTNKNFSSYIIHEDTKIIACGALADCERLGSIIIPDSVTHIGDYAFDGCTSLTEVKMGNNVEHIGEYAFYDCSIESVMMPVSLKTVGLWAFSSALKDVYYTGSAQDWNRIAFTINSGWNVRDANIHYNYVPEE